MKTSSILIIAVILFTVFIFWKGDTIVAMVTKPKYAGDVSPYDEIISKYADMYGIDPLLIRAVIRQESNWSPDIMGFDGLSIGLMQITKPLAHDFFYSIGMVYKTYNPDAPDVKFSDFVDPEINIRIGSWKLSSDMKYYKGDLEKTLLAYNMGRGNVDKGYTNDYAEKVLAFYDTYKGEATA